MGNLAAAELPPLPTNNLAEPPPGLSIRERITNWALHTRLGQAAVGSAAALTLVGAAAETAQANATAGSPVAHEARSTWTHLGGDPLVPRGLHNRHDFVKLVTSRLGQDAMKVEGLNKRERAAVTRAARQGKEFNCTMRYGQHFDAMVFGLNGAGIDRDVVFKDPRYRQRGASSYCLDAIVTTRHGYTITRERIRMLAPKKCGNLALINIVKRRHRLPPKTTPEQPQPGPTPTPTPVQPTPTPSPTPTPETPPPQPPPEVNHAPTGRGDVQHRYVNSSAPVCVETADQDNDPVNVTALHFWNTSSGQPVGFVTGPIYQPNASTMPNVWCQSWTAPDNPQSVTWSADLKDSRGASGASTPDEFPVLAQDTGPTLVNVSQKDTIKEATL